MFRASLKGIAVCTAIFGFILFSTIARLFYTQRDQRLRKQQAWVQTACKLALKFLHVRTKSFGLTAWPKGSLFVGNHLGFLDVLCFASQGPTLFVTSMEMRETPLLGYLTELGRYIYVERRNRTKILSEKNAIASHLKKGFNVVLYPEGTSIDGIKVLPFKRTLLLAATDAGAPFIPFAINIPRINGRYPSRKTADAVCWYGDTGFALGLWRLLNLRSVELEFHYASSRTYAPTVDREWLASELHSEVRDMHSPLPPQHLNIDV